MTDIPDFAGDQLSEILVILSKQYDSDLEYSTHHGYDDSAFLLPQMNNILGLACVAGQKYISEKCRGRLTADEYLKLGPVLWPSGICAVEIINAAANHWKHIMDNADQELHPKTIKSLLKINISHEIAYYQVELFTALQYTIRDMERDLFSWGLALDAKVNEENNTATS